MSYLFEGPAYREILSHSQLPISPNCVFDASLVPGTCPARFLDLKGLINKFLESRIIGKVVFRSIFTSVGSRCDAVV